MTDQIKLPTLEELRAFIEQSAQFRDKLAFLAESAGLSIDYSSDTLIAERCEKLDKQYEELKKLALGSSLA